MKEEPSNKKHRFGPRQTVRSLDEKLISLVDLRVGASRPGNNWTTATQAAAIWEAFQIAAAEVAAAKGISKNDFLALLAKHMGLSIQLIEEPSILSSRQKVPLWTKVINSALSDWERAGAHDLFASGSVRFLPDTSASGSNWLTKIPRPKSEPRESEHGAEAARGPKRKVTENDGDAESNQTDGSLLQAQIAAIVERASEQIRVAVKTDNRKNQDIARAADITPVTLSQFMGGTRRLSAEALDRLASVLGISLATDLPTTSHNK